MHGRKILALGGVLAVCALAACGGGGDDDHARQSGAGAHTPTPN